MGLRSTCWSDPSVGVCKAMIRNKETLNETRLLPSMIYYCFTSLYLSNLQFLMKIFFKSTGLSMIQNLTIPASSLFFLGYLLPLCLFPGLVSGLIHTKGNIQYPMSHWSEEPLAVPSMVSSHDQIHDNSSQSSWWVHESQFLAFVFLGKGSIIQVKAPVLEGVIILQVYPFIFLTNSQQS